MTAQISATTRKHEQFLLLGLLPFVLGLFSPSLCRRFLSGARPCAYIYLTHKTERAVLVTFVSQMLWLIVGTNWGFRKKSVKMNWKLKTYK